MRDKIDRILDEMEQLRRIEGRDLTAPIEHSGSRRQMRPANALTPLGQRYWNAYSAWLNHEAGV